jgi:hypothetical protein
MQMRSVLLGLLVLWGAVTAVLVCMLAYRSRLEAHEEDQIFLAEGEQAVANEQRLLLSSIEKLNRSIRVLTMTSGTILVVTGGLWLWQVIETF